MLKNYIIIALRNMKKNKIYSFINIFGLAVGITCCILILMYIEDELSYDKHFADVENTYRIESHVEFGGRKLDIACACTPMGNVILEEIPEIKSVFRFRNSGGNVVHRNNTYITEDNVLYADTNFFNFFSVPLLKGDKATVLAAPNNIAITSELAKKYFGNENAMGEVLYLDDDEYVVNGIYEKLPANTHFKADILVSMEGREEANSQIWMDFNFHTYFKPKENISLSDLKDKIQKLADTYIAPQMEEFLGQSYDAWQQQGNMVKFNIRPMGDIHLYADNISELEANGDIKYIYIFSIVAVFVLAIACMNFMNLSTARSSGRAKEVGIRKVLGSVRKQLIGQFLTESLLTGIFALFVGLAILTIVLPLFNDFTGKSLTLSIFSGSLISYTLIGVVLLTGFIAGAYPAIYLSAFQPVKVLTGKMSNAMKSGWLRSGLVIFQFSISIILLIGTLIVYEQLQFIQQKDIGFERDHILILHDAYTLGNHTDSFKEELRKLPEVKSISVSGYLPVPSNRSQYAFWPKGGRQSDNKTTLYKFNVDEEYIQTYGMELLSGRNFSKERGTDSLACIVNESAVAQFGWENPIGKRISRLYEEETEISYEIIGIVKDFHFESLRETVAPMVLTMEPSSSFISLKFRSDNISAFINKVEKAWKNRINDYPFHYSFADDKFDEVYHSEMQMGEIFGLFALISIFVGCLGLFGLSAYTAEQKTKEIGIRKVLGATIGNVVYMLSKEFIKLVTIAFIFAAPIAYYAMNMWLEDFAYRIDVHISTIVLAGLLAMFISLATVSYHAVKAAVMNPVRSIKFE